MLHAIDPGFVVFSDFGIFSVFGSDFPKVLIKQRKTEETQYSAARLRAGQVTQLRMQVEPLHAFDCQPRRSLYVIV